MTDTTSKTMVMELVGEMLLAKLHKTGVKEESGLLASLSIRHTESTEASEGWERHTTTKTIPVRIARQAMLQLHESGDLKTVSYDGRNYVALASISDDELREAVKLSHRETEKSWIRRDARWRRVNTYLRIARRMDSGLDYKDAASITTERRAAEMPLTDPSAEQHESERPNAYTQEDVNTNSYHDAQTRPWIDSEQREYKVRGMQRNRRTMQVRYPGLDQFTRALVDHQLTTGQATRNADRADRAAKRAWLETDEGQLWLSHQRERELERQTFKHGIHEVENTDSIESVLETI